MPELSHAEVEALVAQHTGRIRELLSEAETSVSGSTLLGRYGGHDVDLVVLIGGTGPTSATALVDRSQD